MNNNNKLSLNTVLNPEDKIFFENSITSLIASYWLAKQYVLYVSFCCYHGFRRWLTVTWKEKIIPTFMGADLPCSEQFCLAKLSFTNKTSITRGPSITQNVP
jgi:hypothetical protein